MVNGNDRYPADFDPGYGSESKEIASGQRDRIARRAVCGSNDKGRLRSRRGLRSRSSRRHGGRFRRESWRRGSRGNRRNGGVTAGTGVSAGTGVGTGATADPTADAVVSAGVGVGTDATVRLTAGAVVAVGVGVEEGADVFVADGGVAVCVDAAVPANAGTAVLPGRASSVPQASIIAASRPIKAITASGGSLSIFRHEA